MSRAPKRVRDDNCCVGEPAFGDPKGLHTLDCPVYLANMDALERMKADAMTDTTALAARLREIADDPSWRDVYRIEAKAYGTEGLTPASLSDDDIREALRARILAWSEANRRAPEGPCDGPALFAKVNELRASLGHPALPPERPCDLVCQHIATP